MRRVTPTPARKKNALAAALIQIARRPSRFDLLEAND
jgi:hypothetical protein